MAFKLDKVGAHLILGCTKEPYVVDIPRVTPTFLQSTVDGKKETLSKKVGRQRALRQTMSMARGRLVRTPGLQALSNPFQVGVDRARIDGPQKKLVRNGVVERGEVEVPNPSDTVGVVLLNPPLERSIRVLPMPKEEDAFGFLEDIAEHDFELEGSALLMHSLGGEVRECLKDDLILDVKQRKWSMKP